MAMLSKDLTYPIRTMPDEEYEYYEEDPDEVYEDNGNEEEYYSGDFVYDGDEYQDPDSEYED